MVHHTSKGLFEIHSKCNSNFFLNFHYLKVIIKRQELAKPMPMENILLFWEIGEGLTLSKGYTFAEMFPNSLNNYFKVKVRVRVHISNHILPVGAMAVSTSVILGGMGNPNKVSTPPVLLSSVPGEGMKPGCGPGGGVMRIMSGKGVVLTGTALESSSAENTRLHNGLMKWKVRNPS